MSLVAGLLVGAGVVGWTSWRDDPSTEIQIRQADDIGAAVGWTVEVDPAVTVQVMDRAVAPSAARITGGQLAEGYSLRADDVTWRHDQPGRPTLSGPVRDLLLVVFGRLPIDHLDQDEPLS